MAKHRQATSVSAWGTGSPMREFLYVDDMAEASIVIMNLNTTLYESQTQDMLSHMNIETGIDCTIKELTETVANIVGCQGDILWDTNKPDGPARKLLDISCIESLGWQSSVSLEIGLRHTYEWYSEKLHSVTR